MSRQQKGLTIFDVGSRLEHEGYVFDSQESTRAGCGDVYIHPDGSVACLDTAHDGIVDKQHWPSLMEFRA